MVAWHIRHLSEAVYSIVFDKANFAEKSKKFIEQHKAALDMLSTFVKGHGGSFISGHSVRITDFLFFEMSEKMIAIDPGFPSKYPEFMEVRENFKKIPNIKAYMESEDFVPYLFPPGMTAVNTVL